MIASGDSFPDRRAATQRVMTIWLLFGVLSLPVGVKADEVKLVNGSTLDGIIVKETSSRVKVQVAWKRYAVLDRAEVAQIKRDAGEAHEQLRAKWRQQSREAKRPHQDETQQRTLKQEAPADREERQTLTEELNALREQERQTGRQQTRRQLDDEMSRLTERVDELEREPPIT